MIRSESIAMKLYRPVRVDNGSLLVGSSFVILIMTPGCVEVSKWHNAFPYLDNSQRSFCVHFFFFF